MTKTEKVRDTVRLHPTTVGEYQNHVIQKTRTKAERQALNAIKVDLRVWRTALKLANGDRTRLLVRSATEVSVLNQSKRKKKVA